MKISTLFNQSRYLLSPDAAPGAVKGPEKPAGDSKPAGEATPPKPGEKTGEPEKKENLTKEQLQEKQRELRDRTRTPSKKPAAKAKEPAEKPPEKKEDKPPEKTQTPEEKAAADKKAEDDRKAAEDKKPADDKKGAGDPPPAPAKKAAAREKVDVPPPIGELGRTDEPADDTKVPELKTTMDLSVGDKRKLRVIQQMEEEQTAPKGTAEKLLKFWEKEAKYIEDWERANPGKPFEEDDEAHEAFYRQHEVTYDEDSFDIARDNLVRTEATKQVEGERSKEKRQQARIAEFRAAHPKHVDDANRDVIDMIVEASPELAELLGPADKRALNEDVTKKMMEKDPVMTEILQETAEELATMTVELKRLTDFDDVYQANPSKAMKLSVSGRTIYPHALLLDFMIGLENEMVAMDPQVTAKAGKRLVSNAQFAQAVKKIQEGQGDKAAKQKAIEDLSTKYYTLSEEDFRKGLVASYASTAKQEVERFNRRHGLRTPKKPEAGTETPPKEDGKPGAEDKSGDDDERKRTEKPKVVSTSSASDMADPNKKADLTGDDARKSAVARSRGR